MKLNVLKLIGNMRILNSLEAHKSGENQIYMLTIFGLFS